MKIDEAIEQLVQIQKEYGNDIDIYFDNNKGIITEMNFGRLSYLCDSNGNQNTGFIFSLEIDDKVEENVEVIN